MDALEKQTTCPICNGARECSWYVLCNNCYRKVIAGQMVGVRYEFGKWDVRTRDGWKPLSTECSVDPDPVFFKRERLITENEADFLDVIFKALKTVYDGKYRLFPQVALSSIVQKEETGPWRGELFRSVDFLVTDLDYRPILILEINDRSHDEKGRKERDNKLKTICMEAGIPIIFLDGRKGAPKISPEELCKTIKIAQWDLANTKYPTFYFKFREQELRAELSEKPQVVTSSLEDVPKTETVPDMPTGGDKLLLPEIEKKPAHREAFGKVRGRARSVFSVAAMAIIVMGAVCMASSVFGGREAGQTENLTLGTAESLADEPVDIKCFDSTSPVLFSLYDKALTGSQEHEQGYNDGNMEVVVPSTIKKMYFMEAKDDYFSCYYNGKIVEIKNAVAIITNFEVQFFHDQDMRRERWPVYIYPNFEFDEYGDLVYQEENERNKTLVYNDIEDVQQWLYEEYGEMEISELPFPE